MNRLTALGGFDAKGPACFLLEMGGARLLLDLGIGPDHDARPAIPLEGVGRVDAVLISHGHADHVGSLDWLGRLGDPPVYATAPVRVLTRDPVLAWANPLRALQDIAGLAVEIGPAGHAPGAVWMRIGGAGGLLYSGDLCAEGGLFAAAPLPRARAAVFDCSYGAEPAQLADQRAAVLSAIAAGPCLLPAPTAGRGLEIALACLEAGHAVALCPETWRVADLVAQNPDWLARNGANALNRLLQQARRLEPAAPLRGVMVAGGPNCNAGLAATLGPRALQEGVAVIFTGHLAQGAPAAAWVAEGRAQRLRWNVHPNLATLRKMLAEVMPETVLPAFAPAALRADLAAALPAPWAQSGSLTW
ncbi:Cft2 family RNA processing exonuclease [Rhodobacter sp. JA431]|uniref:MBL fold metallo-hydrolase n=1 Tax=Rhodobacter sp. JA431 TaxID=570013 RepID=UPI000BDBA4BE|nr:MBL fold metallo-hydrolase [Rhodobacter sp. JA431]SOC00487.1 Cft2 family RNA processing exonuclease [Rhodobacter sp. JA431]